MKDDMKIILAFILGAIISGGVVHAVALISAQDVSYDNTNSGLKDENDQDVNDAQTALDILELKTRSWEELSDFGVKVNSTNNILATPGGICFTRSSDVYCIASNSFSYEKTHVPAVFSDVTCTSSSSNVSCNASDYSCSITSTGNVECTDKSNNSTCSVLSNGTLTCN